MVTNRIIVHIDLTGPYTEGMNYQENILPYYNALHGYKTYFIATCYEWNGGNLKEIPSEEKVIKEGVILVRIPYKRVINDYITQKVRKAEGIEELLRRINPDIIMLHCLQSYAYIDVLKYVKENPNVVLYADTHTDKYNSATNFLSYHVFLKK